MVEHSSGSLMLTLLLLVLLETCDLDAPASSSVSVVNRKSAPSRFCSLPTAQLQAATRQKTSTARRPPSGESAPPRTGAPCRAPGRTCMAGPWPCSKARPGSQAPPRTAVTHAAVRSSAATCAVIFLAQHPVRLFLLRGCDQCGDHPENEHRKILSGRILVEK